jgi:hypothetical protein
MTQSDGYPGGTAANLNIAGTHRPLVSRRRIEHLKQLAFDCNLTAEQAREYGKLSATATWEKLLTAHGLEFDPRIETTNNAIAPANQDSNHSINFFEWIDFGQAFALALASVGFAVLLLGLFPRLNPLNLLPVKITIQVGK